MNYSERRDRGASVAMVVAVVACVLIAVAVGYTYISSSPKPKDSEPSPEVSSNSTEGASNGKVLSPAVVRDAYDTYVRDRKYIVKSDSGSLEEALNTFKAATTEELSAQLQLNGNVDPVLCTDKIPEKLTYSGLVRESDQSHLTVTDDDNVVNVKVYYDTGLEKITSIECL